MSWWGFIHGLSLGAAATNLVLIWWNYRSIRACYDAHELLIELCIRAWRLRDRGELWPIYQRTVGQKEGIYRSEHLWP